MSPPLHSGRKIYIEEIAVIILGKENATLPISLFKKGVETIFILLAIHWQE